MKVKELRELSKEELTGRIDEARKSLVELRFQLAMRKLENPARIRTTKRELAQMLTIMTEKEAVKG
ncbi:MAG: 50S ribosomal protein L29 [Candidatus Melainabacteria bacterium]|jgi:large subunit ribosomal protein L29|uniref:Large ribosomal subunit protein uL29 n=1 Tax=Candidatus Obscuribacter phosphatis TaxID=1906157 RepID=A0A8J7TLZ1_9BACT|nr:50S ribosomal protein L29 [Candidatus Obscuribacter phosphatis]MCA0313468.1 50S ribosomal protein L29 [Candidatus Melainabacteria bacterium]